ncbi:MAG: hypothetical protein MK042_11030 [Cognatishimia sp.]|nr:hypothetical protein [Cognatishimia sp.]NQY39091.1 hypothetical protein [Henriciella sp.]
MHAEIVRLGLHQVDIKVVNGDNMHVLQWRRNMLWDEVLLDGKRQAHSSGFFGREKVYGLVFGSDENGNGGAQVMLLLDPSTEYGNWSGSQRISGIRLEAKDGPIVSYGSLDPQALQKPATFADWMKKTMGMEWGR